jgi:hypothetical protein
MIAKPTPELIEAIMGIRHTRDFEAIAGWLRNSLAETFEVAATADSELVIRRAQGAAQDLTDILNCIDQAPTIMQKMKTAKR